MRKVFYIKNYTKIFKFHCDSINIPWHLYSPYALHRFKFHCDSINIATKILKKEVIVQFKFHCDSINIEAEAVEEPVEEHLNSTVILLIWGRLL